MSAEVSFIGVHISTDDTLVFFFVFIHFAYDIRMFALSMVVVCTD
jgi:hypothetical protein